MISYPNLVGIKVVDTWILRYTEILSYPNLIGLKAVDKWILRYIVLVS